MMERFFQSQLLRFLAVGGTAAATHLSVVALVVPWLDLTPLAANVVGFLTAFWVSYAGHRWLTFAQVTVPHRQALPRFFSVSCASFVVNEMLYALALHWLPWHYLFSLAAVLVVVAAGTFFASKFWAFARPAPSQP